MKITSNIDLYKILTRVPETTREEARAVADSLAHVNGVATSSDLAEVKSEMKAMKSEIQVEMKAMKSEMKSELSEMKAELTWRMFIAAGLVIAAIGLMLRL